MTPMSYRSGASAGRRKCWCACNTVMSNPLTAKITVEIRIRRIRLAVSAWFSGVKPGAARVRTNAGARTATIMAMSSVRAKATLMTVLTSRQVAMRSSCAR